MAVIAHARTHLPGIRLIAAAPPTPRVPSGPRPILHLGGLQALCTKNKWARLKGTYAFFEYANGYNLKSPWSRMSKRVYGSHAHGWVHGSAVQMRCINTPIGTQKDFSVKLGPEISRQLNLSTMRTRSAGASSSSAPQKTDPPASKIMDSSGDVRVLIAHNPSTKSNGLAGNLEGQFLQLRHPKSGNSTCYILMNGCLQELHWFKQQYNSWFIGNSVCEDGSLYMATPIDPIFVVLPLLDDARMKKGDELGMFRSLDEILFLEGYPGYAQLLLLLPDLLSVVCEVKEAGSMRFYRLDDRKLLAWLCCKVKMTMKILPTLNRHYSAQSESDAMLDAIGLLGEYLKEDPWLHNLCNHLGVNLEATKKPRIEDHISTDINSDNPKVLNAKGDTSDKSKASAKKSTSKGRTQKKVNEKGLQKITSMFKKR